MLRSLLARPAPYAAAAAAAAWYASSSQESHGSGFSLAGLMPFSRIASSADAACTDGPLSPKEFRDLKLVEKEKLTHNSYRLRLELPGGAPANLPVASCLLVKAAIQSPGDDAPKVVVRPYTPVSAPDAAGYLDLVIKSYPTGKLSKHLAELPAGSSVVAVKGPIPKYPYTPNAKSHIGMVAGGTGITPMLQVADHILANPGDRTRVSLIFANVSESDILLKSKIDRMAAAHPDRFSVYYLVDKPSWGGTFWKGGVGYVTRDMLAAHMPAASEGSNALIMVCGPPGMMAAVSGDKAPDKSQGELTGLLKAMGYTSDQVYKF